MGNPVNMTPEQKELKERLYEVNQKLWAIIKKETKPVKQDEKQTLHNKMAKIAHELHMSLKASGYEPKHHKNVLENMGIPVEDIEFYNHIHAVDDLLKFIEDENANDDTEDTTIGKEFTLRIYTRRWKKHSHYPMIRTESGWNIQGNLMSNSGDCAKDGSPSLYNTLDHDSVCYPKQIGKFFERIWEEASKGLTAQEVQECFNTLGEWISSCEMNTPRDIFESLI